MGRHDKKYFTLIEHPIQAHQVGINDMRIGTEDFQRFLKEYVAQLIGW